MQSGQYLPVSLYEFRRNKPLVFSGIKHDADPQDFMDVCDHLCTTLGCSSVRAVELTRAVKRASPSGFGLALAGFGLNGSGQKSPDLNGSKKLRT